MTEELNLREGEEILMGIMGLPKEK